MKSDNRFVETKLTKVSIGIMAHNEEQNIAALLDALVQQHRGEELIKEILVVSSGSVDLTDKIVSESAERDPRIRLIIEPVRRGKAAAINLFLKHAASDILVLQSADTLPLPKTIFHLLEPFSNDDVGMTGGCPTPANILQNGAAFAARVMWKCHHLRNLSNPDNPKLGELIAFRKVFDKIYERSAVDEAEIEELITRKGFRRCYCPQAVVVNSGPESFRELFQQRLRIHLGNIDLAKRTSYRPLYGSPFRLLYWGFQECRWEFKKISYLSSAMLIEFATRILAAVRTKLGTEPPYIWTMMKSGKKPHAERARAFD